MSPGLLIQALCLLWTDGRSGKTNTRLGIKHSFLLTKTRQGQAFGRGRTWLPETGRRHNGRVLILSSPLQPR